jgi:hypothetical protein
MKKLLLTMIGLGALAAPLAQAQLLNSWENSQEGWVIDEGNWTSQGFSTTNGVTLGTYSWVLAAASGPDYGAAFTGPSSTTLTYQLAHGASVSVDVLADAGPAFGFFMQWDLAINQPGSLGAGFQSLDGFTYSQSPNLGSESTLTWTIPPAIRQALLDNPSLATSLTFQVGGGGGGTIRMDNLRVTPLASPPAPVAANLNVRETWDDYNKIGDLYPAKQTVTNNVSSLGFVATAPWLTNPLESGLNGTPTNTTIMSIRSFFAEPLLMGLPANLDGTTVALVEDNSGGPGGLTTLWSSGDWMVRPLAQTNAIDFNAEGEYWFSMTVGQLFDAQFSGDISASGAGGIGFSDGANPNAGFVAIGITGTNLFLGPPDDADPFGTINASKSVYISQGTLGQAGNTNSLIYNPINDPAYGPTFVASNPQSLTNFTGGPYFVNAFGTNRQGMAQGEGIVVLGHLVTHSNGNATIDAKFYNAGNGDQLDLTPTGITWDCSYSFHYTNTMANMLVFENGEFPFYIYAFRAGTTLASVVGMDAGYVTVAPLANTFTGFPINMTNTAAVATPLSNNQLLNIQNYGTINYQWYQNGIAIPDATARALNIASAATNDPAMPAGTDAGIYTSVATDASGTWGSVTTAPVTITVTQLQPPHLVGFNLIHDGSTIQLTYDEPNLTGADQATNYTLNDGVVVTNVIMVAINGGTETAAQLQTTLQPQSALLTLTINNIINQTGGKIATNTKTNFWSDSLNPGIAVMDIWSAPSSFDQNSYYNVFLVATPHPYIETNVIFTRWDQGPPQNLNLLLYGVGNNQFGGRQYGWFTPAVTTNYVFFCCADDGCRLSLSTDEDPANLKVIAAESQWSNGDSWTNFSIVSPAGDHRGDGTATGVINANVGFDNSAAGASPATADLQNRSDQFLVAYNDSLDGVGNWPAAISQVTSVVAADAMNFWPTVDANGQALIHLVAGHRYFMQAEYQQGFGGTDLGVTYKFAGDLDPASPSVTVMNAASNPTVYGTISSLGPFTPSVSIGQNAVITYTGILQSSTNVAGPYSDIANATSTNGPATFTPSASSGAKFFRSHR